MVLVLLAASSINELVVGIIPVVALMALNFYLHGRHLAQQPVNPGLIALTGLMDIAVITVAIVIWPDADQRGLASPFFVMYYPVVLAFAFVMQPRFTLGHTLATLGAYAGASALASGAAFDLETLVARLVTLGAMGGLGTYYWRIQRDRRRSAAEAHEGPSAQPAELSGESLI